MVIHGVYLWDRWMAIHQNLLSLLPGCFTGDHFPSFPANCVWCWDWVLCGEGKWRWQAQASQVWPLKGSFGCCSVLSPSPRLRLKLGSHTAPSKDRKKQGFPCFTARSTPLSHECQQCRQMGYKAGTLLWNSQKNPIKLSLLVTSKANQMPIEPVVLKEWINK